MDKDFNQFDQIAEDLGLEDENGETKEIDIREQDSATGQQHSSTKQVVNSLQQLLSELNKSALTDLVADLCRADDWTSEVITNDPSRACDILARRYLPQPESVKLVIHTASRVTVESVNELFPEDTAGTTTKYTIIVSEPPSENALEKIQQHSIEVIELGDLAQEILTKGMTDFVVQYATTDEQVATEHNRLIELLEDSANHSIEKSPDASEGARATEEKPDATQTPIVGESDYIDIEVVGFENKYIEYEDRDDDILEDKKYTMVCLYINNKTSYEWEFRGCRDLAVNSTDGFSYDNPQDNSWSDRSDQFTPWNNGWRHNIKPNSKARIVVIYKTWFEPERIEYSAELRRVHGDDDQRDGTERISIKIDESSRDEIRSLPDTLPIDSVVLN